MPRRGDLSRDAGAVAWTADEELRRDSGRLFIGSADLVGEAVDRFDPHQVDRAAAETAAGHARAEHAVDATGEFDQDVDLAAADLVVVAHADVRSVHQPADFADLTGLERRRGALDAIVLGDDVAAAAQNQLRQQRAVSGEVAER